MALVTRFLAALRRDEDGQGLAEDALILALIAIVAIIALIVPGTRRAGIVSKDGGPADVTQREPAPPNRSGAGASGATAAGTQGDDTSWHWLTSKGRLATVPHRPLSWARGISISGAGISEERRWQPNAVPYRSYQSCST